MDNNGFVGSSSDLKPPMLNRAAELFSEGMTVREVAATLRISKSEAGRLRIRAFEDGLLSEEQAAEIETATTTIQ
jgi:orotate phosphoribosyltransferase-like protein